MSAIVFSSRRWLFKAVKGLMAGNIDPPHKVIFYGCDQEPYPTIDQLPALKRSPLTTGFPPWHRSEYVRSNGLERVAFGLYRTQDAWDDGTYVRRHVTPTPCSLTSRHYSCSSSPTTSPIATASR